MVSQNCSLNQKVMKGKPRHGRPGYYLRLQQQALSNLVSIIQGFARDKIHTPGASKQHKLDTTEVLWQDCGPVVKHPDEWRADRSNSGESLLKKGVASARSTKMWESKYCKSITREQMICQFGAGTSSAPAETAAKGKGREASTWIVVQKILRPILRAEEEDRR